MNEEIRLEAAGKGVKLWQIAMELGMSDSSFSRKLREELTLDEKEAISTIINKLKKENVNANAND